MSSKLTASAAVGADDDEDVIVNETTGATIGDVIAERLDRRDLMTGTLASVVLASALPTGFMSAISAEEIGRASCRERVCT